MPEGNRSFKRRTEQRFKASSEGRGLPHWDDKNVGRRDGEKKKELAKRKETSETAWEGQHFKYLFILYAAT